MFTIIVLLIDISLFYCHLCPPPLLLSAHHSLTFSLSLSLMVLFFSLLSVFLSCPFVLDLHWGQVLAGMIAEPAFLSEYTIFALDHSKRPKTAQVASVVSLPPTSCLFLLIFSSSSSCLVPSSHRRAHGDIGRSLWPV